MGYPSGPAGKRLLRTYDERVLRDSALHQNDCSERWRTNASSYVGLTEDTGGCNSAMERDRERPIVREPGRDCRH
jgi:hypothetical protein